MLVGAVHDALHGRVSQLTVLVALGTHAPMSHDALADHLGAGPGGLAARFPGTTIRNHEWADPSAFASVGTIGADRVAELSGGLLHTPVDGVSFDLKRQIGELNAVVSSKAGQTYLAESYTGWPGQKLA